MIGRLFGKLEVVEESKNKQGRHKLWICRCTCGGTAVRRQSDLLRGTRGFPACQECSTRSNGRKGIWKQSRRDLYILEVNQMYKIGSTGNFDKRIKEIRIGSPYEVHTRGFFPNMGHIEGHLQRMFEKEHLRGEWYSTPLTVILNEVQRLIKDKTDAEALHSKRNSRAPAHSRRR
jgi:hypothetical protein